MSYTSKSITATVTGPTTVDLSWSVTGASTPSWSFSISGSGSITNSSGTRVTTNSTGTASVSGLSPNTTYSWTLTLSGAAGSGTATSSSVTTQVQTWPLTWDMAGGTAGATYPSSINDGDTLVAPYGSPTRSGYAFNGWSPSLPKVITSATTLTATWLPYYSVSYNLNGGSGGNGYQTLVLQGQTVSAPTSNPTRTGADFAGWSPSFPYTNAQGPLTFTATWNVTVYWNYNSGSGSPSQTGPFALGGTVTTPYASRSGYDFMSWDGNGQSLGQSATTAAINSNTTFIAQWQASAPPPSYPPSWSDNSMSSTVTAGVAYSDGVSATNMNYSGSYSVVSGSLPAGLSLNTSTGAVTGTPTAVGTYSFTIRASNSYGSTDAAFNWTVNGGWYTYKNGAWVASTAQKYDGSSWVTGTVYKYDGSQWLVASN